VAGHPGAVQRVDNRYELRETIGRGGFGVVWRAHDTLLQRDVAVKEIRFPGVLDDAERAQVRERVLREARAAARLNHPGAVTVYDVVDVDGQPFIVMELVAAPTLSELVERHGPLAPARMAAIALELLDTLTAAHALGIVHRDVKPANVMVAESGRVRLADFGIAAILDDPKVTTSGDITGSPSYMAPEQVNNQPTGAATDLWSLGATMYFGVEGEPPFSKGGVIPTLTSIASDPPRPAQRAGALATVLDALLVKDPARRLDAATLRDRLSEVVTGAPVPKPGDTALLDAAPTDVSDDAETEVVAPPPPPPPPPPAAAAPPPQAATSRPVAGPPPRRAAAQAPDRRPAGVLAALCIVAILGLVVYALSTREPPSTSTAPATEEETATTEAPSDDAPDTTARRPATTARPAPTTAAPAPVGVPANWVPYTDPDTGFTIAHPPGWTVSRNGTLTDFRDPNSATYLRVDHVQPPGPSPEGAWYEFEPSFAAANANYQRIQITPTTYKGHRAAIWEFTYTGGGAALRAVDLGFVTDDYGFALNFQTRAEDWERMQPVFEAFKAAFEPPDD